LGGKSTPSFGYASSGARAADGVPTNCAAGSAGNAGVASGEAAGGSWSPASSTVSVVVAVVTLPSLFEA
jgi:hypothetical protein